MTPKTRPSLSRRIWSILSTEVGISKYNPKIGNAGASPLGAGHSWRPGNTHHAEFVRPRLNGTSVMEMRLKMLPTASQGHRNWHESIDRSATYDFLLMFHSNHGSILYRFRDIARYCRKCEFFWTYVYLMPHGIFFGIWQHRMGSKN